MTRKRRVKDQPLVRTAARAAPSVTLPESSGVVGAAEVPHGPARGGAWFIALEENGGAEAVDLDNVVVPQLWLMNYNLLFKALSANANSTGASYTAVMRV